MPQTTKGILNVKWTELLKLPSYKHQSNCWLTQIIPN